MVIGLGIAALAICMASLGDAQARRRRSSVVSVLGAPASVRARAHIVSQALPTFVVAATAVLLSRFCVLVFTAIDARAATSWTSYLLILAISIAAAVVVAVLTIPVAVRPFQRQDLT